MARSPVRRQAPTLVILLGLTASATRAEEPPRHRAMPTGEAVVLDGRLDEAAWRDAPAIRLTQKDPVPGGESPYVTEVRVLRGERALYFGFRCVDPEPSKILVHGWERDGDQGEDDRVAVLLDTFSDRRTGYLFRLNAAGARQDGLVAGPDSWSPDWDGLWNGRTSRDAGGWSAEIEIPIRSLRFAAGDEFGFNAVRYVARARQMLAWTGISLDASPTDFSRAGRLAGLEGMRQGLGMTIAPYALARWRSDREADTEAITSDVGFDLAQNLTPQLGASITVNTDFAETEVDARQVNLTRFPLFFPEKRAFFLEGSNLFAFGLGLDEKFLPFYSRRVGLFAGEPVPILAGGKLLGRAGRFSIAALDVMTRDGGAAPETNLFASRVTWDATPALRVGVIATDGDPDGVAANSLFGGDVVWRTPRFRGDKNLAFSLWGAKSAGDVGPGRRDGWGARLEYPNDLWYAHVEVDRFGDALAPALGFLPRPGTRQLDAGFAWQPRPRPDGRLGWIRQLFFENFYDRVERPDGTVESWRYFSAPFNAVTPSGVHLEANWAPEFQRLFEPFEVAEGVVIRPGDYRFDRFRVEASTATNRAWQLGTSNWFGTFFDGRLAELEVEASWQPLAARLRLELTANVFAGDLPAGSFTIRLAQLRAGWAFTPDLVLSSFLQYDSDSGQFGANTRLRWTLRPGSDFFLVWTRGYLRETGDAAFRLRVQTDELVAKLRWTFQL